MYVSVFEGQNHHDLPRSHIRSVQSRLLIVNSFHFRPYLWITSERVLVHSILQEFFATSVWEILWLVPILDLTEPNAFKNSFMLLDLLSIIEIASNTRIKNFRLEWLFAEAFTGKVFKLEEKGVLPPSPDCEASFRPWL